MLAPKAFVRKYRQKIIIIVSAVLFVLGLASLYNVLVVSPISNDECLWIPQNVSADSAVIYFDKVKVNGVAWNAGIRNGDVLLAIGDVRITNTPIATYTLNKYKAGEYAKYTVRHSGRVFETRVYIKKLISFGSLGLILLGLIWFMVSFIVVMAKPEGYVQRLFYRIGAVFMLFLCHSFLPKIDAVGFSRGQVITITFLDFCWTFASIMLPFLFVHFFMVFPRPFRIIQKQWFKKSLYIVPSVLIAIMMAFKTAFYLRQIKTNVYISVVDKMGFLFVAGLVAGLILLLINFFRLKDRVERKPFVVIVVCYILGILSTVYSLTIATVIADTIFNTPEFFMPIILVAIIPVAFGYSIFRYQLMDVSVVVKNAVIYGAATVSIAAIYFLTVYGLGQGIGSVVGTEYRNAIAAIAFVVFAIIFQSTKNRFQDLLTRKFYPEQFAYQQVILKFGNDVVSIVGHDNILDSMTKTFVDSLKINQFAILLNNPTPQEFRLKRSSGIGTQDLSVKNNEHLTHYIREKMLLKTPITIDQQHFTELLAEDAKKLTDAQIYTIIPMVIKAKVIGLLCFGLKRSGSQFADKDLELLCAAGNQAAVAIENARLYESEAQKFAVERDLQNARKIQENLLPKIIPQVPGIDIAGIMIPAMQVGGDYFDVIQVSPTKMFAVVGDVSGKGLSASLYMSKLQTMMRLYCVDGKSPKDILTEVNKRIYESIERNWFITVNLALIDTQNRKIKFCRAGHSPLLVLCHNEINLYQPKGIGLGLEVGKVFADTLEEVEIEFGHDNIFALYSDGISEAMNRHSDLFGLEKLSEVIRQHQHSSAKDIISSVMKSVDDFRDGREQNDDITMVFLKTA